MMGFFKYFGYINLQFAVLLHLEDVRLQLVLGLRGLAPDVVRGSKRGQLGCGGRLAFLRQRVNSHVLHKTRHTITWGRTERG